MTDLSSKRPVRIRTFAGDLAIERQKRNPDDPALATKPTSPAPAETKKDTPKPKPQPAKLPTPKPKPSAPIIQEPHITVPNKPAVTKIPAFHELQKQASLIQNTSPQKAAKHKIITPSKKKEVKEAPHRANVGFDATIITDTKADGFQFFSSLFDSLHNWFKKLLVSRKKKETPKYTVPETQRRKGVIQRATSKSGTLFTADSETLKEQIRKRRLQEAKETETSWSPYTEPGYNLLEAPDKPEETIKNVAVEYTKPTRPEPEKVNQTPAVSPHKFAVPEKATEVDAADDQLDELRWKSEQQKEPVLVEPTEVIPPEPTPITEPSRPEPIPAPELDQPSESAPEVPPEKTRPSSATLLNHTTNTLTVVLLIVIVGVVAVLFLSKAVIAQLEARNAPTISTGDISEPILQSATIVNIPLTVDTLDTLPALVVTTIEVAPTGLVELPIVSPIGDEVTPSYTFELLGLEPMPVFKQSLTAARFVSINHSEPALLLQFVDRDTVLGGFLTWETTMTRDFHPLYNLPADIPSSFTDESVSDTDVRVLRHNGKVLLVYGIVGNNTALITTDLAVFKQIVELGVSR